MRQRIAPYASIVALVGAACVVVALGAWLVAGALHAWIEILGAAGLALLSASVVLRPSDVKTALTGRQARYGGNAVLMSVAFLVVVALVDFLGARYHLRWDVTAGKQFSLSEQSTQILSGLQQPVQVKLFFTPGAYNRQEAEDLVKEYAQRSPKVTYQFIDPDTERRIAMDYQIGRDGTIVFESGGRREITFGTQEQDLTGALLKVTRGTAKGVYFLTGHQERSLEAGDATSYSAIKQSLTAENYQAQTLNLAVTNTLPSDLAVLVVAGPRVTLEPRESARLVEYVNNGGKLLLLIEAGMLDPLGGAFAPFGFDLPDALIVDPARSFFGDVASPLVDRYAFHQITKDMTGMSSFFPTARPIVKTAAPPAGWAMTILASTSESSWGETAYKAQRVKLDEGEPKGPLTLAAAIERSDPASGGGRIVVIGDASFVEDGIIGSVAGSVGNLDLFMNSIGWLAEERELISIRPKQPQERSVVLTPPQARGIIYSNVLFVPLLVLAAGAVVWWRRR